jgi:hypothetical protein
MKLFSLKVFENSDLRRIFRHEKEKVIGDWRKLHDEALHNFHSTE